MTKRKKRNKQNKTKKCKWSKCEYVPCGKSMPQCKPNYCHEKGKLSSRNWGYCNILNLVKNKNKKKYKNLCKKQKRIFKKCKHNKTRKITKLSVDVHTLHNKMPFIWRFLKPNTRKHMIELAKMPISKINIPFSLYGDNGEIIPKKYKKLRKTLKKKYKKI